VAKNVHYWLINVNHERGLDYEQIRTERIEEDEMRKVKDLTYLLYTL